jgi:RNA ligase (TIGR02306 family)
MDRKLASIRKISSLEPIEGADRIEVAHLDGWQVVTQKGWAKPGDLVVYFEIDSFLPVRPQFEFLRKQYFKSTKNLGDGFRLKTIKLRKTLSQGLILSISDFEEFNNTDQDEGMDVTELLKVQKYEKPVPTQLAGRVRGNFPMFIRKTDQERAQNLLKEIRKAINAEMIVEATVKLDGSSMTVYNQTDKTTGIEYQGVCSRNWDLDAQEEEGTRRDSFWKCAEKYKLTDFVKKLKQETGINYAIQGELMGPGVQENREKLDELNFFLFDIWNIDEQRYLLPKEKWDLLDKYDPNVLIDTVPYITQCRLIEICNPACIIDDLQRFAERPSLNNDIKAEGVVFKAVNEPFSFKIISNEHLLETDG